MKRFLLATAAIAGGLIAQGANAAFTNQTSSTLGASATVSTACTIDSTAPIAFGEVNLGATATDQTGTISVTCTNDGSFNIGMGAGLHDVSGQHVLKSGSYSLNYNLYQDVDHAVAWNNTGAGLEANTGTGSSVDYTVYGEIPGSQAIKSGNGTPYTDTVTVYVNY